MSGVLESKRLAVVCQREKITIALGSEYTIRIFDTKSGQMATRIWDGALLSHAGPVTCLAFSLHGKALISGSRDRTARIWPLVLGGSRIVLPHDEWVIAVGASENVAVTATIRDWGDGMPEAQKLHLWDLSDRLKPRQMAAIALPSRVRALSLDPAGSHFYAGVGNGLAYGDWPGLALAYGQEIHTNSIEHLVLSTDGRRLASADEHDVAFWSLSNGIPKLTHIERKPHAGGIRALAFAPDGKTLFSAGWGDRLMQRWTWPANDRPKSVGKIIFDRGINGLGFTKSGEGDDCLVIARGDVDAGEPEIGIVAYPGGGEITRGQRPPSALDLFPLQQGEWLAWQPSTDTVAPLAVPSARFGLQYGRDIDKTYPLSEIPELRKADALPLVKVDRPSSPPSRPDWGSMRVVVICGVALFVILALLWGVAVVATFIRARRKVARERELRLQAMEREAKTAKENERLAKENERLAQEAKKAAEQKAAREEDLRQKQKGFFETVTHDYRHALLKMRSPLKELETDSRLPADCQITATDILTVSKTLETLVRRILMNMISEDSHIPVQNDWTSVDELVRDATSLSKGACDAKQIKWERENALTGWHAFTDAAYVNTILHSLLDNAIKYTAEKGYVSLRVYVASLSETVKELRFSVTDNGIGISDEDLPHVFDAHFRGSNVGSEVGWGMGLAIAQSLATALGGRIEVFSQVQKGTQFSLCLPVDLKCPEQDRTENLMSTSSLDRASLEKGILLLPEEERFEVWTLADKGRTSALEAKAAQFAIQPDRALVAQFLAGCLRVLDYSSIKQLFALGLTTIPSQ